jgi:hypothetical protein
MAYKWAYDFTCEQPIETILAVFNSAGPWQWQMRDSAIFGDYLSCRPNEHVWVRIHEYAQLGNRPTPLFASERFRVSAGRRDNGFAASLQIDDERASTRAGIDAIFRRLLQGIGVSSIAEIEPYD